ncbi:oligopeptide/dipeptide ABC transporter, ATP-binding protein, C-terminal domain-containing protein [Desulfofundulus thermosubterraneus DSM 16057]|uniref:Oligopeptide/dipeptide ABC transporter, ATP-binding protein, C-terminal domain-containing protein n=1 Tax=Desulfofundulus thermosubterraneus DSM 16057 TaxID=1121432 RepID=A0A1M6LIL5_9FIRM|nr:oligopeptide/dipeptide ABC transporter, ATP-binding protein, C-terminal domain-containing protein [Desulfofundulus thermosubterraneus DSM 16057]
MAIILITHDLGVVAAMADEVAVMYAGSIVELGPVAQIFDPPAHPYTRALLRSVPCLGKEELVPVEGQPPSLLNLPAHCAFFPRCPQAGTGASFNFGKYSNPRLDSLADKLKTTFNVQERNAIAKEDQQVVLNDAAFAFLVYPKSLLAVSNKVEGIESSPPEFYLLNPDVTVRP